MYESKTVERSLNFLREGFRNIGYNETLLKTDYTFDNAFVTSTNAPLQARLAVFGQEPVSSRTSCFGVIAVDGDTNQILDTYKSLGAPYLALLSPNEEWIEIWNVSKRNPEQVVKVASENIVSIIQARREQWEPSAILRAKAVKPSFETRQLDFYDFGLIPELESAIYKKLDELLNRVLTTARNLYKEANGHKFDLEDYSGLFQLVFRFIAAKILGDRGQNSADWLNHDSSYVVRAVTHFYFKENHNNNILDDKNIAQKIWDIIRESFNFQNISVEAIANTYETTWITEKIRKEYSTHATPYKIAEYIVRKLPFEQLPLEERTVFEPFCGHAPFLIASLGRLRELLPIGMEPKNQHEYFKKMLTGMDKDDVAREFATLSLILADYPNANGWNIEKGDVFNSPSFDSYLQRSSIILCNPPYEQANITNDVQTYQAVEALRRVLKYPPKMLGFVLPRIFVNSDKFRQERKQLANLYNNIEVVALPDSTFLFSEAYTVLLIAYNGMHKKRLCAEVFDTEEEKNKFLETNTPSWTEEIPTNLVNDEENPCFWYTPIDNVLEKLNSFPRLGNYTELHRGVRFLSFKVNKQNIISSNATNEYFKEGIANIGNGFEPYIIGVTKYFNTKEDVRDRRGGGWDWRYDKPKIIVNAARNSRGPWRITGIIDTVGLYFTQQLIGIWPKKETDLTIELIAAVINSAVANAFLYSKSHSRQNNEIKTVREIPIPYFTEAQKQAITSLTKEYIQCRKQWLEEPENENLEKICQNLVNRIDGHILTAYGLKPSLEKQLLDYFKGSLRPGPVNHVTSELLPTVKPYKALIRVKKISGETEKEKLVEAEILSWDTHKTIRLPYSRIPQELRNKVEYNVMLIANVNVGARYASEIFIDNIELAIQPDEKSYN